MKETGRADLKAGEKKQSGGKKQKATENDDLDEKIKGWLDKDSDNDKEWIVLTMDGLYRHVMDAKANKMFWDNHILVLKIRSQLSSALQPLDLSVYGPVNKAWRKLHLKQRRFSGGAALNQYSRSVLQSRPE